MMMYSFLADVMVATHVAFLVFTLLGQLAILVGVCCGWRWARNPWFRCIHLAFIVFVAYEYVEGIKCPLTTWEEDLRELAGEKKMEDASFIGRCMNNIMFFEDLEWDHPAFGIGYVSFAVLVLATFVFAPPRFWRQPVPASGVNPASITQPVSALEARPSVNGHSGKSATVPDEKNSTAAATRSQA
jgi:hypothetical protein